MTQSYANATRPSWARFSPGESTIEARRGALTKSSAGIRRPRHRLCQLSVRRARFLPAPNCPQPPQAQFTASHGRHHHQPRLPDCLSPSPRGHCRASRTLQAGDPLRSPQAPQPPCRGPAGGTWPGSPRWSEAGRPPPSQPSPATPAPANTAQPLALPSRLHSRRRRTASTRTPEPPPTAPSRRLQAQPARAAQPRQEPPPVVHRGRRSHAMSSPPRLGSSHRRRIRPRGHPIYARRRRIRPPSPAPPRAALRPSAAGTRSGKGVPRRRRPCGPHGLPPACSGGGATNGREGGGRGGGCGGRPARVAPVGATRGEVGT